MEQTPGVGVAGIDAGDKLGGGRSSGLVGVTITGLNTRGAGLLRHLLDELEPMVASE